MYMDNRLDETVSHVFKFLEFLGIFLKKEGIFHAGNCNLQNVVRDADKSLYAKVLA